MTSTRCCKADDKAAAVIPTTEAETAGAIVAAADGVGVDEVEEVAQKHQPEPVVIVEQVAVVVEVDVIVPVRNAASTLRDTIRSALYQKRRKQKKRRQKTRTTTTEDDKGEAEAEAATRRRSSAEQQHEHQQPFQITVHVCCYDDGSTDDSWDILQRMQLEFEEEEDKRRRRRAKTKTTSSNSSSASSSEKQIDDNDTDEGEEEEEYLESYLWISKSSDGVSRGAGYARNRAVQMRQCYEQQQDNNTHHNDKNVFLLCWLDSDDIMHPTRIIEQVQYMMSLDAKVRQKTVLGCNIVRDPPNSTWHYTEWINNLSNERLILEQYRELTVVQPTWMMCKSWFVNVLGMYIEAPPPIIPSSSDPNLTTSIQEYKQQDSREHPNVLRLIHPTYDTCDTLRVAEDLRLWYAHLHAGGLVHKIDKPLLTYRHRQGQSQSSNTPRKLLLQLRTLAFETRVLNQTWQSKDKFIVWGAGRDGKDFVKALSPTARRRIYCFVDVDEAKINTGYYVNNHLDINLRIPIVHFSLLIPDDKMREKVQRSYYFQEEEGSSDKVLQFGRINKSQKTEGQDTAATATTVKGNNNKRQKKKKPLLHNLKKSSSSSSSSNNKDKDNFDSDLKLLPTLPVVVCVALYRTNGALENNVKLIGRTEGKDLWHFS